ncbi:fatty acyl-AMP ligase [Streptomyces daliensis]
MPPASSPQDQRLTDLLDHWAGAGQRGARRAFTAVEFGDHASAGTHRSLTWSGLRGRALAVAERLERAALPGDRAALLLPQGLDYVAAFLGCLYAGVVAVPLFTPDLPGHEGRLAAVLADCEPACVLTDSGSLETVSHFLAGQERGAPPVLTVDGLPSTAWEPPVERRAGPGDVAYLQYTSGSTRVPAGVALTHRNVVANASQAVAVYARDADATTTVSWLPLFHDMGLVLSVAAPVFGGFPSVLMDPVSFLVRPVRWLRLMSRYPGVVGAAPNFAYDYCASRVTEDEKAELDLTRVRVLINGSEPVRPSTVTRFREAFGPCGLRAEAHCPSYGLAEATVFVCADPFDAPPSRLAVDRAALNEGKAVPVDESDASALPVVTCGAPVGQRLRIVDAERGTAVPDGEVGEIWLQGPNIGACYWNRPEQSAETFAATLAGEEGHWLRTGDLGALHEGALLVTGRLKDLIIIDGRNHYPQDIEETVQRELAVVRRDRAAAFTVPGEYGAERLVVVAERGRDAEQGECDSATAADAARAVVSTGHGVRLADFLLVAPGAIPRTSSGKVSRAACRERYLEGSLR